MPRCPHCRRRLAASARCADDGGRAPAALAHIEDAPWRLDGYTIEGPLGGGGFATVWAARDRGGRPVAIKRSRSRTRAAAERFAREADALARVGAAHAPALLDAGADDGGRPLLVLERLAGRTLAALLEEASAPPPLAWTAEVAAAVLRALAATHRAGLVHRDLKPENVHVAEDGDVRLFDFGLAEPVGARPAIAAGTAEYMAPEQLRAGCPVDGRTDVYAAGVLLYELVTLRVPFAGDRADVEYGHLALRPPPASGLAPLPPLLEQIIGRCLHKAPDQRPDDCAALAVELGAACRERPRPASARRLAPAAPLRREPVVLLVADAPAPITESAAAIAAHRGALLRCRGARVWAVFPVDATADPIGDALGAAAELARRAPGARAALELARLRVRDGGGAAVHGRAIDQPETWLPAEPWDGVVLTDAFARALPAGRARPLGRDGFFAPVEPPVSHDTPAAQLIGRGALLRRAEALLGASFAGGTPTLVSLIGAPGTGKSRMSAELGRLVGQTAPAATVLRLRAPLPEGPDSVDGERWRRQAQEAPLAILLDDAHRADDRLLDAVEYATLDGDGVRLFVAVTADASLLDRRPGFGARAAAADRHRLDPLDEEDAMELLAAFLWPAQYPPDDTLRRLVRWADRNPLHLEQIVRGLRDAGLVRRSRHGDHWELATDELDLLPRSPAGEWLAARRLDELPADLAQLAGTCAAADDEFGRDEIEAIEAARQRDHGRAVADPDVGLFQLCRRGLLAPAGKGRYRFTSAVLRDGVYRLAGDAARTEVHQAGLAYWRARRRTVPLDAAALGALARHAAAVGARAEVTAAHLALGDEALRALRHADAERHYGAALTHDSDGDGRARALLGRGRARYHIGRVGAAIADLTEASTLARGDPALAAECLLEAATARDWAGDYPASASCAEAAAALVTPLGDARLEAMVAVAAGRTAWRRRLVDEAARKLADGAEAAAALGDDETRIVALLLLGPALVRAERLDEAEARFDEVITLCERIGDRLHLCAACGNRMFLWSARRQPHRAREDLRRARDLARRVGHPLPERVATYNLAEDLYWAGEVDEAARLADRARVLARRFLDHPVAEDALLVARVALARDRFDDARGALAWIEAHVAEADRSASVRALSTMVSGALAELSAGGERAPGDAPDWDGLIAEAAETLPGDELLEILYWRAEAARRAGRLAEAAAAEAHAATLLPRFPIWQARFGAR